MNTVASVRITALRDALEEEVHGLWISNDMAIKVLAAVDKATCKEMAGKADLETSQLLSIGAVPAQTAT